MIARLLADNGTSLWYNTPGRTGVGTAQLWLEADVRAAKDMSMTREEFSRYVAASYTSLLRFVQSRVAHPHDAEDVLQHTLMRLLPLAEAIDARAPDGFIFTALRNGIIDYWRKRGRRPPVVSLSDQQADEHPAGPDTADRADAERECRDLVRQAASRLTPREQKAFALYWKQRGDRAAVLAELELTQAGDEEKYRVYDGPLYHARRKLGLTLLPHAPLLADVGYVRVWELVAEVLDNTL